MILRRRGSNTQRDALTRAMDMRAAVRFLKYRIHINTSTRRHVADAKS
jgi:hypothetical protein